MANYTPPAGDDVDFTFSGDYTAPDGDNVDFFVNVVAVITVESVSRDKIFDDQIHTGANTSRVYWHSSAGGSYRVELGGSGVNSGHLIDSGNTFADFSILTEITDADVERAATFSGAGDYRFNIYVKNSNNVWTPYNQT